MPKSLLSLMLLLLLSYPVFAQKQGQELTDSLLAELSTTKSDTVRVRIFNGLSNAELQKNNNAAALSYAQHALKLSQKINYPEGAVSSLMILGSQAFSEAKYPDAIKYSFKSLEICKKTGNKKGAAECYDFIGSVYWLQGNYPQALNYGLASLRIYEETGDKNGIALSNNGIGVIYTALDAFPKALKHYSLALKVYEELNDKMGMALCYTNMGSVYETRGYYSVALQNHFTSLRLMVEAGNKSGMAACYHNIGSIYSAQGNYPEALKMFFSSLGIREEEGDKASTPMCYSEIGSVYFKQGNLVKSKEWLAKGLKQSRESKSIKWIAESYRRISKADSALGNYKSAFENYKMHIVYRDSMFNEESTRKLTQTEMNFEFEKKQDSLRLITEKEIAVRDATLASNRIQKWFYFAGLSGLTVIGGLLFNQSRLRKKKNRELDEANRIKTRFFSILNHDLRSPVSNLVHYLHLKKESPGSLDDEAQERLERKTMQGAENLLVTMEDLLLWSKGQMENFKPNPVRFSVKELFEDTLKYFSETDDIDISFENPDNPELFTDENYLKTIVRNLMSNAVKALQDTQDARIIWKAGQSNGQTVLSVTDNGSGADSEKFRALYDDREVVGIGSGLGLHLIRDLAKAINCKIEVSSVQGTGTTFRLLL